MTDDPITLRYAWEEADYPAYQQANRRYWEVHRGWTGDAGGWRDTLGYYLYYAGPAVLGVLALMALEQAFPARRFVPGVGELRPETSAYGLALACVLVATWVTAAIYRRLSAPQIDAQRRAFDSLAGEVYEVVFDTTGFRLRGGGGDAWYAWAGHQVPVEIWGDHVLVLHPRMMLIIPARATAEGPAPLAAAVAQLQAAAEAGDG